MDWGEGPNYAAIEAGMAHQQILAAKALERSQGRFDAMPTGEG